jgi:hypothetical protein
MDAFARQLLVKFPSLNPAWPVELQDQWFQLFTRLLDMGKHDAPAATPTPADADLIMERARRLWAEAYIRDLCSELKDEPLTWEDERNQGQWVRKARA